MTEPTAPTDPEPLGELGGPGIRRELDAATRDRALEVLGSPDAPRVGRPKTRPEPLTAESLYRCRWYAVPDDEVGGWAIATVNKPTSQIDPVTSRDRVLVGFITWDEHARWIVEAHNAAWATPTT